MLPVDPPRVLKTFKYLSNFPITPSPKPIGPSFLSLSSHVTLHLLTHAIALR